MRWDLAVLAILGVGACTDYAAGYQVVHLPYLSECPTGVVYCMDAGAGRTDLIRCGEDGPIWLATCPSDSVCLADQEACCKEPCAGAPDATAGDASGEADP